jgi:MFS family permease
MVAEQPKAPVVSSRAYYALLVLTVVFALNFMDRNVASILIDPIKKEFQLSDTVMGLIVGFGFTVLYALLGIPIARLSDRGNRRNIISAGLFIWSAFTALSGFAYNTFTLAATRVGVGIGESCGWAPSVSMISDYFPRTARARAIGILASASTIGAALGFLVGGVIGEQYGWRNAFFVAGIPGILMVLVLRFTVTEPEHGASEAGDVDRFSYPLGAVLRFILSQKSAVIVTVATIALGIAAYGYGTWTPSLLRRVHHMSGAQIGYWLGTLHLALGVVGAFCGGYLADIAGKRDPRWLAGVPAILFLLYIPAVLVISLAPTTTWCLIGIGAQTFLTAALYGPCWSLIQSVVRVRMRSVALAISLALNTFIGLGLGAPLIGAVNDALLPHYGPESIRFSMLTPAIFLLVGAVLFCMTAKDVDGDIQRALQPG